MAVNGFQGHTESTRQKFLVGVQARRTQASLTIQKNTCLSLPRLKEALHDIKWTAHLGRLCCWPPGRACVCVAPNMPHQPRFLNGTNMRVFQLERKSSSQRL